MSESHSIINIKNNISRKDYRGIRISQDITVYLFEND